MTSSPGAPGRHAGPARLDDEPSDWLSAPEHVRPRSGLPSGLSDARRGPRSAPEPDPWPAPDFSAGSSGAPQAWETPRDERHRSVGTHRQTRARLRRPHPLAYGLVGLVVGLGLSVALVLVLTAVFPSLLPAL